MICVIHFGIGEQCERRRNEYIIISITVSTTADARDGGGLGYEKGYWGSHYLLFTKKSQTKSHKYSGTVFYCSFRYGVLSFARTVVHVKNLLLICFKFLTANDGLSNVLFLNGDTESKAEDAI